jgi:hypothetical protein
MKYFSAFIFIGLSHSNLVLSDEPPFSRVFNSTAQRTELDQIRYLNESQEAHTSESTLTAKKMNSLIKFSGVVLRSDGKHMFWINGQSRLSPSVLPSDIKISSIPSKKNFSYVSTRNSSQTLKAGQIWDQNHNKIFEAYQIIETDNQEMKKKEPDKISNIIKLGTPQ